MLVTNQNQHSSVICQTREALLRYLTSRLVAMHRITCAPRAGYRIRAQSRAQAGRGRVSGAASRECLHPAKDPCKRITVRLGEDRYRKGRRREQGTGHRRKLREGRQENLSPAVQTRLRVHPRRWQDLRQAILPSNSDLAGHDGRSPQGAQPHGLAHLQGPLQDQDGIQTLQGSLQGPACATRIPSAYPDVARMSEMPRPQFRRASSS